MPITPPDPHVYFPWLVHLLAALGLGTAFLPKGLRRRRRGERRP